MNNIEVIILLISGLLYLIPIMISTQNLLFFNYSKNKLYENSKRKVSVLIPARNEENSLRKCVESAIDQGTIVSEIIIYDDHSTDKTSEIIKSLIQENKNLVKKAKTKSLPKGWLGKNFACYCLSLESKSENILFIDADTILKKNGINNIYNISIKNKISMVSAWPKIKMETRIEKILMPILNLIVFSLFPYIISTKYRITSLGLAHGACILFNKKAYSKYGGHKLVKSNFFEDTSLAKKWRKLGENSQIINGKKIIEVRMYETFHEIIDGFTKNFYPALGNIYRFIIFQFYFLFSYIIFPIVIIYFVSQNNLNNLYLLIIFFSFLPRIMINIKFNYQLTSLILNPFSILIMLIIGLRSFYYSIMKKKLSWKQRVYKID